MQHTAMSLDAPAAPSPHLVGTGPEVLESIALPDINLSLWQRPVELHIAREVTVLAASQLPKRRLRTSADSFASDVTALLRERRLDPRSFDHLLADLCLLADRFFTLSGNRDTRFQLVTTDSNNCGRFHVDTRHLRMICTYQGPATEWLRNEQVDRFMLERGAPNHKIIRFGEPAHFEPFWVGIMKGDPDRSGNGLVHRSPPIVGTGQTRVLFCLDAEP